MICNYVKHLNIPNFLEEHDEKMIPRTIHDLLNKERCIQYSECLYEWFGYNFYLYNLIYNYKNCINLLSVIKPDLENLIQKLFVYEPKGISVIQNRGLLRLLSGVYDITEEKHDSKMAPSVLEMLIDRNLIMSPLLDASYNIQDDSNAF